jgi:hypothetical protein
VFAKGDTLRHNKEIRNMQGFNGTPTTTKPNRGKKGTRVTPKAAGSDNLKKGGKGK